MWLRTRLTPVALALGLAACGARGSLPAVPAAALEPAVVDAPAGDAETVCATHPVYAEASTFFTSATIEAANSVDVPSNGDLWPSCPSGDALVTAWGDGFGFNPTHAGKRPDIGVARLVGTPWDVTSLHGENLALDTAASQSTFRVWTQGPYYQKPTGMLCLRGRLYLAVQDLNRRTYDDVPAATIASSGDGGRTWVEGATPMFRGGVFTTVMFLDAGPAGPGEPYVYAYGLDHNWRATSAASHVIDPQGLYLARIAVDKDPQSLASWEFFAGLDAAGGPTWSPSVGAKKAVLTDCTRRHSEDGSKGYAVLGQGGIVYDAPLRRYIYTSWTEYTFEFYEAPAPWGPWRRFLTKDFGLPPWTAESHGGYGTTIPSRFISADGKTLWVQSNTWSSGVDHNNMALRKLIVVP
jgi:hypothetical protein